MPARCSRPSCSRASTSWKRACAATNLLPTTRGDAMDPSRLTERSQQALHDAQTKALRFGHTEITPEHVLLALLDQPEGLAQRLFVRQGIDTPALHDELERE